METAIIRLLGRHTYKFLSGEVEAIYKHRGKVYCIIYSIDTPFEDLSLEVQEEVYNLVVSRQYKITKTVQ